jgi:zinc protease
VSSPTSWTSDLAARYELLEEAGRGGMGVVYKAKDRETGEIVALKILKPEIAADRVAAERFINEVRLSRRITHKNVCRVYEFTRAGSTAYLSMEYVEGESLRALLERIGAVTFRKGTQIARQICAALYEAHSQGIIHRDLKPENVMLDRAGSVKVMDFGIARLLDTSVTSTGGIIGTPAYMAPEQAEGHDLDARTDIYATGLILYELFTGRPTFTGDTPITIALKQIREAPIAPRALDGSIPPGLDAIILKCLEKDPAQRFQSIAELDAALAGLDADLPPNPLRQGSGGQEVGSHERSGTWPTVEKANTTPLPPAPVLPPNHLRQTSGGQEGGSHEAPRDGVASAFRRKAIFAGVAAMLALALAGGYLAFWRTRDPVPFTRFTLANGLTVLLSEDHSAPTVAVAVVYNVGSRDDPPGRTGFAHLFEHMMFAGSLNVGMGEHQILVSTLGGNPNGQTFPDHTQFWETLPANQLDLALFLEADRMRSLRLDEARLRTERGTVLAERAQRIDNTPFGRVFDTLNEAVYDIPGYQRPALGTAQDLQAATLQEVTDFFKVFYAPNNAVLSVVGDFKPSDARAKIENYFQHIPAQPPAPVADLTEPEPTAERRLTMDDPLASEPRVFVDYKTPPGRSAEWESLEVLAGILGDGDSSRLHQKLVKETETATGIASQIERRSGPGTLLLMAVPSPSHDTASLLKGIDDEIARVRDQGVSTEEVARARNRIRLAQATLLQQTAQRAFLLGEYETKYGGADGVNTRVRRLDAVTPASVQKAAAAYLTPARRTTLTVTPGGTRPPPQAAPANAEAAGGAISIERLGRAPISKDVLRVTLPRPRESTLDNGLTLLVAEDRRAPLVAVRFEIRGAGRRQDPPGRPGTATAVAAMIREGTATRSSRDVAQQLDTYGATLAVGAGGDPGAATIQATGLSETFDAWFPVIADLAANASFPSDELTTTKRRLSAGWRASLASSANAAFDIYTRAVYGDAAGAPIDEHSFDAMTSDALLAWHRAHYTPANTVLTVAGAISPDAAERRIRESLGGWKKGGFTESPASMPAPPPRRALLQDRPGAVQTSIVVGASAVERVHPDYLALFVANRVLGGSPAARLFVKLREERGLTTGIFSVLTGLKVGGDARSFGDVTASRQGEALDLILAEIGRMAAEPVPAAELESAKRSIVASFALTLEQLAMDVSYMTTRRIYGLSPDYWDRYPEKIMAISAEDVQRVSAKYLAADRLQIIAVGDAASLAPLLAAKAPVTRHP